MPKREKLAGHSPIHFNAQSGGKLKFNIFYYMKKVFSKSLYFIIAMIYYSQLTLQIQKAFLVSSYAVIIDR
jgi:hypothetical protein